MNKNRNGQYLTHLGELDTRLNDFHVWTDGLNIEDAGQGGQRQAAAHQPGLEYVRTIIAIRQNHRRTETPGFSVLSRSSYVGLSVYPLEW